MMQNLLREYYGFSEFLPGQEEVIQNIARGCDTLAVMPTGGGKSLCYQLPAMMFPGITLVVSPLIALMKDQVDVLQKRGMAASFINSSLSDTEIQKNIEDVLAGKIKILYVAPERLVKGFVGILQKVPVSFVAIDEAHCVSMWGHDFRPDYRAIKECLTLLPKRPIVAGFTATATPEVRDDIVERLGLLRPRVFVRGFDRPNLFFTARWGMSEFERNWEAADLVWRLEKPGIVYVGKRDKAEELAEFFARQGVKAVPYHAGMKSEERTAIQEDFMQDRVPVIVATIAFGMGVDKRDVRFVVHVGMPGTLEGYYQEAGRAGRDGKPAVCVLLHSNDDGDLQRYFIRKNYYDALHNGKPEREADMVRDKRHQKLEKMEEYAMASMCRRRLILNYFGDPSARTLMRRFFKCGACDHCAPESF